MFGTCTRFRQVMLSDPGWRFFALDCPPAGLSPADSASWLVAWLTLLQRVVPLVRRLNVDDVEALLEVSQRTAEPWQPGALPFLQALDPAVLTAMRLEGLPPSQETLPQLLRFSRLDALELSSHSSSGPENMAQVIGQLVRLGQGPVRCV